jgi:hypothetical protein
MHRYAKYFPGFFVGAALTFFVAQVLGIFPTQINYCSDHEAGYNNCASHYLVLIPLIWIANHLEAVAAILTGIATAYIAKFTIVLSRAGKQQAADARIVQQAYVFPIRPISELLVREDQTIYGLRLRIPWKNSGSTPAVPVNSLIGATWVKDPTEFKFGAITQEGINQPFVLGPSAEIESGSIDITPPHLNDLLIHHQGHQFFWGWARYRDVFPNSPWHVVEFCFRVTAEGQLGLAGAPVPRIGFAFHGPHNRYYDEAA